LRKSESIEIQIEFLVFLFLFLNFDKENKGDEREREKKKKNRKGNGVLGLLVQHFGDAAQSVVSPEIGSPSLHRFRKHFLCGKKNVEED
jgi:hypothetical protein